MSPCQTHPYEWDVNCSIYNSRLRMIQMPLEIKCGNINAPMKSWKIISHPNDRRVYFKGTELWRHHWRNLQPFECLNLDTWSSTYSTLPTALFVSLLAMGFPLRAIFSCFFVGLVLGVTATRGGGRLLRERLSPKAVFCSPKLADQKFRKKACVLLVRIERTHLVWSVWGIEYGSSLIQPHI